MLTDAGTCARTHQETDPEADPDANCGADFGALTAPYSGALKLPIAATELEPNSRADRPADRPADFDADDPRAHRLGASKRGGRLLRFLQRKSGGLFLLRYRPVLPH